MTPQSQNPPTNSVQGIEALILFGLQVFAQVFSLFRHPTSPIPVSAAPAMVQQMQATPGASEIHKQIINTAVTAAIDAHNILSN